MKESEVVRVYRGSNHDTLRSPTFTSSCESFAADYGDVQAYDLTLEGVFDTRDAAAMIRHLPLDDPWDDTEIATEADYLARSNDTWSMVEELVRYAPASHGKVIVITEGGTVNYVVTDTSLLVKVEPSPAP